jgi:hypothetical protein
MSPPTGPLYTLINPTYHSTRPIEPMSLPLPPELCRYVYDFIHPARQFQKFVELLQERDDLFEKLSSHDNLNVAWPWDMGGPSYDADYLQHRDIETNTRDIRVLCCELENAAKKMEEKKGYLLRLESINAHVREFYRDNPKRLRPTNPRDFTEHQYHSYWMAETSDGQIERMEKNISIRRGLWGKGDRILYDSLNLILTQGDIRDLLYQCEINGIKIPAKLQQRPTTQIETRQFRRELVILVQSF